MPPMSSASIATARRRCPAAASAARATGAATLAASAAMPIAATVEYRTRLRLISILPFQFPGLPPVVELILYQIGSSGRRNRPTRSRTAPDGRQVCDPALRTLAGRRHFGIIPNCRAARRRRAELSDAPDHHDRALPGRRPERRADPRPGRTDESRARPDRSSSRTSPARAAASASAASRARRPTATRSPSATTRPTSSTPRR